MNDACDSRFLVLSHSREGQPPYCMKLINIHDVEVSISVWVSHVMPLKNKLKNGWDAY